jgi:hypothetical protein
MTRVLISCCLFFLSGMVLSQEKNVEGVVTNEKGETMPFVTIRATQKQSAVNSDLDGRFRITVFPSDTLSFQFIGYETQLIPV